MRCEICDYNFDEKLKTDQSKHQKIHKRFLKAVKKLKYTPSGYLQREEGKADIHKSLNSDANIEVREFAAQGLIRAWFDRSLFSSIYDDTWENHPNFAAYAAMILADDFDCIPKDVLRLLKNKFGTRPGFLKPGTSFWSMSI